MDVLQTLGINSAGETILAVVAGAICLIFLAMVARFALTGIAIVILALAALVGVALYGDAAIVGAVAVGIVALFIYGWIHIPHGTYIEHYHIGRDGEIHRYEREKDR